MSFLFIQTRRDGRVGTHMVRSELIQRLVAENPELSSEDVEAVITTFFGAITDHLAAGGRVEIRRFGMFSTRLHDARTGRDPRTGNAVAVHQKRAMYFRPSRDLGKRLNA
jgi:integration host factor subunit beta